MTERMVSNNCAECGEILNARMGVGNTNTPVAGSVSICMYCGNIAIYTTTMTLRAPTSSEYIELMGDERVIRAVRTIRDYWAGEQQ